jgi:hypothetical protein
MQNTRLNTVLNRFAQQLSQWATMPWRRLSLLIISLLFGNFLASLVSTTTGQRATLDTEVAVIVTAITEIISWLTYNRRFRQREQVSEAEPRRTRFRRPLWIDLLNGTKLGFIYGLFLEAFKLGS